MSLAPNATDFARKVKAYNATHRRGVMPDDATERRAMAAKAWLAMPHDYRVKLAVRAGVPVDLAAGEWHAIGQLQRMAIGRTARLMAACLL